MATIVITGATENNLDKLKGVLIDLGFDEAKISFSRKNGLRLESDNPEADIPRITNGLKQIKGLHMAMTLEQFQAIGELDLERDKSLARPSINLS